MEEMTAYAYLSAEETQLIPLFAWAPELKIIMARVILAVDA